MSMDLYLWKAPVIDDADEARSLIDRYFDDHDQSVFEPSGDLSAMAKKLRAAYPDDSETFPDDDCPWSSVPFEQTDRLLVLNIRWSADNAVLDAIIALAAEQDLVVYDPQGPDVYRAREAPEPQPLEKPTAKDFFNVMLLFVPIAAATLAAWWFIPWGWVRWPLVAIGGFLTISASIVVYSTVAAAMGWLDEEPRAN